ncbi:MAG: hypothetical protein CYG59_21345 [Chloroflexi bacterium]|nr:MAG: hypothetical protein CYG59_21345 [Chloroflexota bacterium]
MYQYVFDQELVRIAIVLGIVTSMLFYNRYGTTTGGAIVPGYLALFVPNPLHILTTFLMAFLTYVSVQKVLRPRLMLWGRRLFEAEILVTLLLQTIFYGVLFLLVPQDPTFTMLYAVGFVLPGVIAHDMGRQGVRTTLTAATVCLLIVFGLVTLIGAFRDLFGFSHALINTTSIQPTTYTYPPNWLLGGVIISVLSSIVFYHRGLFQRVLYRDALRTGGFVSAAYLALFVYRPLNLLFVVVCSALTYIIVTRFFMKHAILFGRAKLSAMFLTGMLVTWSAELLIISSGWNFVPWQGFNAITPAIVALLANDAQREGPARTMVGVGAGTLVVFGIMTVVQEGYRLLGAS